MPAGRSSSDAFTALLPKPQAIRVLILGSGGREHAIAHHLLKSPRVQHVYVAPGNGGTASSEQAKGRCTNLTDVKVNGRDFSQVTKWAVENDINLVVPGPEQPLVDGAEEAFRKGESSAAAVQCLWTRHA